MVAAGEYRFGEDTGRLVIRTYRTGFGSRAGHDLTLELTAWQGTAHVAVSALVSASHRIDAEVERIVGRLSLEQTVSAARWQVEARLVPIG